MNIFLFEVLANDWEAKITHYDATRPFSDPEDWMAGHRECLEELHEVIKKVKNDG